MNNTAKSSADAPKTINQENIRLIRVYRNEGVTGFFDPPVSNPKKITKQDASDAVEDGLKEKINKLIKKIVKPTAPKTATPVFARNKGFCSVGLNRMWQLSRSLGRLIAAIIICGILINIAAELWPGLKTEIPYLYGFFNGLMMIVEKGFKFFTNTLPGIFG